MPGSKEVIKMFGHVTRTQQSGGNTKTVKNSNELKTRSHEPNK